MRTRDHCSNPKHVICTCLNVMAVSMELDNFSHVNVYANKAASSLDLLGESAVRTTRSCRPIGTSAVMFKQVLQDAEDYEIGSRSALLRLSLLKHDVIVNPDVVASSRR